jgi:hypothetical protein
MTRIRYNKVMYVFAPAEGHIEKEIRKERLNYTPR